MDEATNGPGGGNFPFGTRAAVSVDALNFRWRASLGAAVVDVLPYGTTVIINTGQPVQADGYTWYEVVLDDGQIGWVAGEFLVRV